jgi:hypothetical protein
VLGRVKAAVDVRCFWGLRLVLRAGCARCGSRSFRTIASLCVRESVVCQRDGPVWTSGSCGSDGGSDGSRHFGGAGCSVCREASIRPGDAAAQPGGASIQQKPSRGRWSDHRGWVPQAATATMLLYSSEDRADGCVGNAFKHAYWNALMTQV